MASVGTSYEIFRPTGNGGLNEMDAGDYTDVDDIRLDTSDYIQSTSMSGGETQDAAFTHASTSVNHGAISKVTVHVYSATTTGGGIQVLPLLRNSSSGVVTTNGSHSASGTPAWYSISFTTAPGGLPWTWDDLSSYQFGVRHHQTVASGATVRTYMVYMVVEYTGVYFQDGAPDDGTDFRWVERADIALKNYIQNYRPLEAGNITDLTDYIATKSLTIRAHEPSTEPTEADNSTSQYPLLYIFTTATQPNRTAITSGGLAIDVDTRIILWTDHTNPSTSAKEWWAIAGAIQSLITQSRDAPDNPGWVVHYNNWGYPEIPEEVTPDVVTDTNADDLGRCRGEINISWTHIEDYEPATPVDWTPDANLTTNLIQHLEADKITGLSDGDPVDTWSATVGVDGTESGTDRPVYKTDQQNGLPAVYWDGTVSQGLILTSLANAASDYTIFTVIRPDVTDDTATRVYFDSSAGRWFLAHNRSSTIPPGEFVFHYDGSYIPHSVLSTTGWQIQAYVLQATDSQFWRNGYKLNDGITYTQTAIGGTTRLGSATGGGSSFPHAIGEFLIFNTVLNELHMNKVNGYLAHKWGLEGSLPTHPYVVSPPQV